MAGALRLLAALAALAAAIVQSSGNAAAPPADADGAPLEAEAGDSAPGEGEAYVAVAAAIEDDGELAEGEDPVEHLELCAEQAVVLPPSAGDEGNKSAEEGNATAKGGVPLSQLMDPAEEWLMLGALGVYWPLVFVLAAVFEVLDWRVAGRDLRKRKSPAARLQAAMGGASPRSAGTPRAGWRRCLRRSERPSVETPSELRTLGVRSFFGGAQAWIKAFFGSRPGRGLRAARAVLLVALFALSCFVDYQQTLWFGRWGNLLQHPRGNLDALWALITNFALLLFVETIVDVYDHYIETWFLLDWKTWTTEYFRKLWLTHRTFYLLELELHALEKDSLDNPDQRIAVDSSNFCQKTYVLCRECAQITADLCIYLPMLWRFSPTSVFGWFDCPGWLVYIAIMWAAVGTALTYFVGRPLIALNYAMQRYDADYRFGLARIRGKSESIAMLRGERAEERELDERWSNVCRLTFQKMAFKKRFDAIMKIYGRMEMTVSLVIFVPLYLRGDMDWRTMSMARNAFYNVRRSFKLISNEWEQIAEWRAAVARLRAFEEACCTTRKQNSAFNLAIVSGETPPQAPSKPTPMPSVELAELGGLESEKRPSGWVDVRGLAICLPNGSPMLGMERLDVRAGDRVLITGPIGTGKSSLLRVLSGVWPCAGLLPGGRCHMPPKGDCLFLPRVPSLPSMALRATITYPSLPGTYTDERVCNVLRDVGLGYLLSDAADTRARVNGPRLSRKPARVEETSAETEALDRVADWNKVLSGGEQQRAVIARILLRQPRFVFLDEAVSSMSRDAGVELYKLMLQSLDPGAAVVSISHDAKAMLPFHTEHYAIDPETSKLELQSSRRLPTGDKDLGVAGAAAPQ